MSQANPFLPCSAYTGKGTDISPLLGFFQSPPHRANPHTYTLYPFSSEMLCVFTAGANSTEVWITALIGDEEGKEGEGRRVAVGWQSCPGLELAPIVCKASVGISAKGHFLELPDY